MRTKTLILSAMIGVAGIASSFAQNVYSVNVVGYINLTLTTPFSMIANQLDNLQGNLVKDLIPAPRLERWFQNGMGRVMITLPELRQGGSLLHSPPP